MDENHTLYEPSNPDENQGGQAASKPRKTSDSAPVNTEWDDGNTASFEPLEKNSARDLSKTTEETRAAAAQITEDDETLELEELSPEEARLEALAPTSNPYPKIFQWAQSDKEFKKIPAIDRLAIKQYPYLMDFIYLTYPNRQEETLLPLDAINTINQIDIRFGDSILIPIALKSAEDLATADLFLESISTIGLGFGEIDLAPAIHSADTTATHNNKILAKREHIGIESIANSPQAFDCKINDIAEIQSANISLGDGVSEKVNLDFDTTNPRGLQKLAAALRLRAPIISKSKGYNKKIAIELKFHDDIDVDPGYDEMTAKAYLEENPLKIEDTWLPLWEQEGGQDWSKEDSGPNIYMKAARMVKPDEDTTYRFRGSELDQPFHRFTNPSTAKKAAPSGLIIGQSPIGQTPIIGGEAQTAPDFVKTEPELFAFFQSLQSSKTEIETEGNRDQNSELLKVQWFHKVISAMLQKPQLIITKSDLDEDCDGVQARWFYTFSTDLANNPEIIITEDDLNETSLLNLFIQGFYQVTNASIDKNIDRYKRQALAALDNLSYEQTIAICGILEANNSTKIFMLYLRLDTEHPGPLMASLNDTINCLKDIEVDKIPEWIGNTLWYKNLASSFTATMNFLADNREAATEARIELIGLNINQKKALLAGIDHVEGEFGMTVDQRAKNFIQESINLDLSEAAVSNEIMSPSLTAPTRSADPTVSAARPSLQDTMETTSTTARPQAVIPPTPSSTLASPPASQTITPEPRTPQTQSEDIIPLFAFEPETQDLFNRERNGRLGRFAVIGLAIAAAISLIFGGAKDSKNIDNGNEGPKITQVDPHVPAVKAARQTIEVVAIPPIEDQAASNNIQFPFLESTTPAPNFVELYTPTSAKVEDSGQARMTVPATNAQASQPTQSPIQIEPMVFEVPKTPAKIFETSEEKVVPAARPIFSKIAKAKVQTPEAMAKFMAPKATETLSDQTKLTSINAALSRIGLALPKDTNGQFLSPMDDDCFQQAPQATILARTWAMQSDRQRNAARASGKPAASASDWFRQTEITPAQMAQLLFNQQTKETALASSDITAPSDLMADSPERTSISHESDSSTLAQNDTVKNDNAKPTIADNSDQGNTARDSITTQPSRINHINGRRMVGNWHNLNTIPALRDEHVKPEIVTMNPYTGKVTNMAAIQESETLASQAFIAALDERINKTFGLNQTASAKSPNQKPV